MPGMSYEEIGQVMGIPAPAVRKIEERAFRKLRANPDAGLLREFLRGREETENNYESVYSGE